MSLPSMPLQSMSLQSAIKFCAVVSLVFLWGCGSKPSLSEYQCSAGDWYTVGESDGLKGYSQSRLLAHQNACGPQGVVPDSTAYRQGWTQGIAQFCEPQKGYQQGVAGHSMSKACPQPHQASFAQAYDEGRRLYVARYEVRQLENAIAQTEKRIDGINTEVIQLASAQLADGLSPQDRIGLAASTRELLAEQQRLRRDLPGMQRDLDEAYGHLAFVETSTPRLVSSRRS